jgi:peroxiredoxin
MLELGQLQAHHADFAKRKARVYAISVEDRADAQKSQEQFPDLVLVSDPDRNLTRALEVIHQGPSTRGEEIAAPTTIILDGRGIVRWTYRPTMHLSRLSPEQVLTALDEHVKTG